MSRKFPDFPDLSDSAVQNTYLDVLFSADRFRQYLWVYSFFRRRHNPTCNDSDTSYPQADSRHLRHNLSCLTCNDWNLKRTKVAMTIGKETLKAWSQFTTQLHPFRNWWVGEVIKKSMFVKSTWLRKFSRPTLQASGSNKLMK